MSHVPRTTSITLISCFHSLVFVHGLGGSPWKTWSTKRGRRLPGTPHGAASVADDAASIASSGQGTPFDPKKWLFWPKELLPAAMPAARIYSWGYDADVQRFMSAAGLNTVHEHGRNLMNSLRDIKDEFTGVGHHSPRRECFDANAYIYIASSCAFHLCCA